MHSSFSRSNVCPLPDTLSIYFPLTWQPAFMFDSLCTGGRRYSKVFHLTVEAGFSPQRAEGLHIKEPLRCECVENEE